MAKCWSASEIFFFAQTQATIEIQILFDFCDRLLPGNFASNGKVFFPGRNCFVTTEKNFLNELLILGIDLSVHIFQETYKILNGVGWFKPREHQDDQDLDIQ